MKMRLIDTGLPGVLIVESQCFQDDRGFFMETWNQRDFAAAGLPLVFVQDAHSRSSLGVLRGLHYQNMTAPMGKLVRCTVGAIYDVAVDLRAEAPSFGRSVSVELSAENKKQLYIPEGFGHGFQVLSQFAEVHYKETGFYTPEAEGVIAWDDEDLAVDWPLPDPIVSDRDRRGTPLREYRTQPAFR